jgi:hypothetical protein
MCSSKNLIQGLGLDGTVGNDLKRQMFVKRPVGKPKKRWMDAVKEDSCKILKWRNLEVKHRNRNKWRSRIKKVETHFGL